MQSIGIYMVIRDETSQKEKVSLILIIPGLTIDFPDIVTMRQTHRSLSWFPPIKALGRIAAKMSDNSFHEKSSIVNATNSNFVKMQLMNHPKRLSEQINKIFPHK